MGTRATIARVKNSAVVVNAAAANEWVPIVGLLFGQRGRGKIETLLSLDELTDLVAAPGSILVFRVVQERQSFSLVEDQYS